MAGTDLCVNKPHCTAAAQCILFTHKSVPVIFEPPCIIFRCVKELLSLIIIIGLKLSSEVYSEKTHKVRG